MWLVTEHILFLEIAICHAFQDWEYFVTPPIEPSISNYQHEHVADSSAIAGRLQHDYGNQPLANVNMWPQTIPVIENIRYIDSRWIPTEANVQGFLHPTSNYPEAPFPHNNFRGVQPAAQVASHLHDFMDTAESSVNNPSFFHETNGIDAYPTSNPNGHLNNVQQYPNLRIYDNNFSPPGIVESQNINSNSPLLELTSRCSTHLKIPYNEASTSTGASFHLPPTNYRSRREYATDEDNAIHKSSTWPQIGIDEEFLKAKYPISEWEKALSTNLQHIASAKGGKLLVREHKVRQLCRPLNFLASQRSAQYPKLPPVSLSRKRSWVSQNISKFCLDGKDIWFEYLFKKTGSRFQTYQDHIQDKKILKELFPAFLFFVHFIDEIVPRSVPTPGEENYSSALHAASKLFVKYSQSDNSLAPSSDEIINMLLDKKVKAEAEKRAEKEKMRIIIGIFVDLWIYSSRRNLFDELIGTDRIVDRNFKGLIKYTFCNSVDNLISRLEKEVHQTSNSQKTLNLNHHIKMQNWPQFVLDSELLTSKIQVSNWERRVSDSVKYLVSELGGRLQINEDRVRDLCKPLILDVDNNKDTRRPRETQLVQSENTYKRPRSGTQVDQSENKIKFQLERLNEFLLVGQDTWFKYLLIKTGTYFKTYAERIRKEKLMREIFPVFLFFIHLIDEIVPRSVPKSGEEDYSSALQSASKLFIKLSNSSETTLPSSDEKLSYYIKRKEMAKKQGKLRIERAQNMLWVSLEFWIYSSRGKLFEKLRIHQDIIDRNFKFLINHAFSHSVDNILNKIKQEMSY